MFRDKFAAFAALFLTSAVLSFGAHAQAAALEPIVCDETGPEVSASGEVDENAATITYGKFTIHFNQNKMPIAIEGERIATSKMPALRFALSEQNAKFSKKTIKHQDDSWGIQSHQRISAMSADGSMVTIDLEDHKYAGAYMGSAISVKMGKLKFSTSSEDEHQVICLTPSEKAQADKDMSGAFE